MKRLWLLFAQAITVALAVFMVVQAVRPGWLARPAPRLEGLSPSSPVPVLQSPGTAPIAVTPATTSYRDAAGRALPAWVKFLTSKARRQTHPLILDRFFAAFS